MHGRLPGQHPPLPSGALVRGRGHGLPPTMAKAFGQGRGAAQLPPCATEVVLLEQWQVVTELGEVGGGERAPPGLVQPTVPDVDVLVDGFGVATDPPLVAHAGLVRPVILQHGLVEGERF